MFPLRSRPEQEPVERRLQVVSKLLAKWARAHFLPHRQPLRRHPKTGHVTQPRRRPKLVRGVSWRQPCSAKRHTLFLSRGNSEDSRAIAAATRRFQAANSCFLLTIGPSGLARSARLAAEAKDVQRLWRMVCGERWRRVRGLASPGVVVLLGASISVAIGEVQWASILSRLLEFVGG